MTRLPGNTEPEIFTASQRFDTMQENVTLDMDNRSMDFDDNALAENPRGTGHTARDTGTENG